MKIRRRFAACLSLLLVFSCLTACGGDPAPTEPTEPAEATEPPEPRDYAAEVKLDMSSDTAKQEVTVKNFVDGDTVHFHVPGELMGEEVLKARFLAIDTPESTGKVEEYGKKASEFTKSVLSGAESILIESESGSWNRDSTGGRYLVWVWYKPDAASEYRNLNIEILQNGLAIANSTAQSRYGDTAVQAIDQAKDRKLNIYSGEPDPDFFYGDAIELTLRELRTNIADYAGCKVAFPAVVTQNSGNQGVYVEDYDGETGLYYGIYLYYGHSLDGKGLEILSPGNEVRVVGTVQYYEGSGSYQIADLNYRMMKPDDPGNIQLISEGHSPAYKLTEPETFLKGQVTLDTEAGAQTFSYAELAMGTSVELKNLKVVDIFTTDDAESASRGAMTLTCQTGDVTVQLRTGVLKDETGAVITADAYLGRTIDARGIVDSFGNQIQIKVFLSGNITIIN